MKILRIFLAMSVVALLIAVVLWRVSKSTTYQFAGDLLYHVHTKEKAVALTFDDGPSPNNTEELLALLKTYEVPATFFMIGKNIEAYPEIAKKVVAQGHQVANHTYSHRKTLFSSVDFFRDEIQKTDALIRSIGYEGNIVFRPPFGKKLITLPLALQEMKKLSVTWDAESEDTETQNSEVLIKNVLTKVTPGSIILFHDGYAKKPGTLAAVEAIIKDLKSKGYEFKTLNDLKHSSQP